MSDSESDDEETIAQDLVVTKYKMAAEIVNNVLKRITEKCVADATVLSICEFGDDLLLTETGKVFKKDKEIKKGLAFPTAVSVNNCICHFSPLKSESSIVLKDGDVVKIDLGAHIDGFTALAAHTVVVGASKEKKVTGKKADTILAAYYAAEAALRTIKPGNENFQITDIVQEIASSYKCKPIEGMLSHELKKDVIDGEKSIIINPTDAQRSEHEKCEFNVHEVYAVDILVSSGEGKPKEHESRTTIYKKNFDMTYSLKMKTSRQFYTDVEKKFGLMAFSLRNFEDEKKAKLGVIECVKHDLFKPFPVLYDREGEFVAQFKFTILLMPTGPMKITGLPLDTDMFQSEFAITDDNIKKVLATSMNKKAAKKKKKKVEKSVLGSANIPATDV